MTNPSDLDMFEFNSAGDETGGMAAMAAELAPHVDEGPQDDAGVAGEGWGYPDGNA